MIAILFTVVALSALGGEATPMGYSNGGKTRPLVYVPVYRSQSMDGGKVYHLFPVFAPHKFHLKSDTSATMVMSEGGTKSTEMSQGEMAQQTDGQMNGMGMDMDSQTVDETQEQTGGMDTGMDMDSMVSKASSGMQTMDRSGSYGQMGGMHHQMRDTRLRHELYDSGMRDTGMVMVPNMDGDGMKSETDDSDMNGFEVSGMEKSQSSGMNGMASQSSGMNGMTSQSSGMKSQSNGMNGMTSQSNGMKHQSSGMSGMGMKNRMASQGMMKSIYMSTHMGQMSGMATRHQMMRGQSSGMMSQSSGMKSQSSGMSGMGMTGSNGMKSQSSGMSGMGMTGSNGMKTQSSRMDSQSSGMMGGMGTMTTNTMGESQGQDVCEVVGQYLPYPGNRCKYIRCEWGMKGLKKTEMDCPGGTAVMASFPRDDKTYDYKSPCVHSTGACTNTGADK